MFTLLGLISSVGFFTNKIWNLLRVAITNKVGVTLAISHTIEECLIYGWEIWFCGDITAFQHSRILLPASRCCDVYKMINRILRFSGHHCSFTFHSITSYPATETRISLQTHKHHPIHTTFTSWKSLPCSINSLLSLLERQGTILNGTI